MCPARCQVEYVHAKCQLGTVAYLYTTVTVFLSSFTVFENSYVQLSAAAMHVHIAGSLILDCCVVSSHSCHEQITSSLFYHRLICKAVVVCNSSNQQLAGSTGFALHILLQLVVPHFCQGGMCTCMP